MQPAINSDVGETAGYSGTERRRTTRPQFLLVPEAAELMRMDPSTLYRHLRADRFPGVKIGGRYLIPDAVIAQMARDALATGRCVVVEEWTARWRERLATEALERTPAVPEAGLSRRVAP